MYFKNNVINYALLCFVFYFMEQIETTNRYIQLNDTKNMASMTTNNSSNQNANNKSNNSNSSYNNDFFVSDIYVSQLSESERKHYIVIFNIN